ncbi:MAG: helix-turn-helix domain-containing protein [Lentisphaerae bacterium]|nr:helix-turn-helix domain-containing protein [Lentisphaerota bacterium]
MLEPLLGSANSERVLLFVHSRGEGYATEIAAFYDTDLFGIQAQIEKLERGGVLVSRKVGRTRVVSFSPRYPFLKELRSLLTKALHFYPEEDRKRLVVIRRRPRRSGKPL